MVRYPKCPDGFGSWFASPSLAFIFCFLDTILTPILLWEYLLIFALFATVGYLHYNYPHTRRPSDPIPTISITNNAILVDPAEGKPIKSSQPNPGVGKKRLHLAGLILYKFLLLATIAFSALEIAQLCVAGLAFGLCPFTFVTLFVAPLLRFSNGGNGLLAAWRWLNVGAFGLLAAMHVLKIAEAVRGKGAWDSVKDGGVRTERGVGLQNGYKGRERGWREYKVDEVANLTAQVAVYIILAVLEGLLRPEECKGVGTFGQSLVRKKDAR